MCKVAFVLSFLLAGFASGKLYDRCELARELKNVLAVPENQLATWVCIAGHSSSYNTRLVTNEDGGRGHGLFQISDKHWCSRPGKGEGCGQYCFKFMDDNIADDFRCAQTIFTETERQIWDGFKAWKVYESRCKGLKALEYTKGCF